MKKRLGHILFHRHLLWEFLRRDLQARYVGSAMGFFWSVINPLILLAVYTVVFGILFPGQESKFGDEPKTLDFAFYIFCGLLPWYAFQEALVRSTTSIVDNGHLIKQVCFPAKVIPTYITLSGVVNQLIGTLILLIALLIVNHSIPVTMVAFPLVLALQIIFMLGVGFLFSTLNTYIRDIGPLVSTGTMILMWAAPMFYKLDHVEKHPYIQKIMYANPITYMTIINHDLVLFGEWPSMSTWGIFACISVGSFILGYWAFTRSHNEFADLI